MKPLKTLIVEDSEMDEKLLLRQLAKAGYDVQSTRVQTAADLEGTLAERDWDVVLSDYAMPGFTGVDALRILRESGQDIPLIIISGTIGEETAVEAMRIGVHDYLMKDNLTRLAPAIERELANAARRREQKQSEESLRRSEANLADAQRIAHLGSWDWDIPNNKLSWSEESYRIFGRAKTQFAGTFEAFLETVHPDDRQKVQAAVDATLTRNAPHNHEHRIIRPNGEERIVCEIGEATFDESGKPLHFTGTVRDITERRAAEIEMSLMKSAVDSIAEGILIADARKPDNPTIYTNAAFEHLTGYAFAEIEGRNCRFLQGADTNRRTVAEIRESIENNRTFRGEILNYRKDGSEFWNDLSISPVSDKTGLVTHYVGVQQDISERRQNEKALTEAARRERLMIENALDVICTVNANGEFVSVSPACLKIWGYSPEELTGRRYIELVAPEDVAKTNEVAISIMSGFETINFENRYRHKNGSLVPIRWSAHWSEQEQLMFAVAHDITAQRRVETELRHSESRIRALLDAIPDLMFRCDKDGVILDYSATRQEDLLLPPSEFVGKNMRDVVPPPVVRQTMRHIVSAIETGTMQIFEYQLELDGIEKSYEARIVAANDNEVTAIVRDVTERTQAEDKLRRSEANLSAAQRITHLGSWEVELSDLRRVNNNKVHWSDEVYRIFGYEPGAVQVSINRYFDSIHPDDRKYCRRAFIEAVLDRKDLNIEFRVALPNGSEKILHGQAEVVYDEQLNQPLKFIGTVQDITERKKAEQELQYAEAKYRNLVESSPAIVYLAEPYPPFSPIYVSPNVKRLGYTAEEWFEKPDVWISLIHEDDRARVLRATRDAMENRDETELEYRMIGRDGAVHWCQDKGRFVTDEQGNTTGWQGVIVDITKTKELEQQLRQSQKLESVGLLAGGIAHDFNNMLTAINGYSDLTLRRLQQDDPLRLNIEEIKKAGERSAALTHQLLAFSRQQILQPVVFDLNEAISDTLKMLQRLIGEDIQLTATLNPKTGRVKVDPGQFSQIVMNLAVNARDAMPQGGRLTVETANVFLDPDYARQRIGVLPGAYVMLAVSDTGVGMSSETKAHIFEPFFTTKDVGEGTGLGLATVYGIIKQSGGNIEVYSEEDVGTTFKIYLPRVGELTTLEKVKNIAADMPRGTETVFLVEDEQVVRQLSRQILEECGYAVIEAQNGVEALKICEDVACKFDLLITDVVMPQMGGRELSEILKSRLPDLKILFTSGYTDDAVVRHGVIETKSNFIQKPFSPETLANKVRAILDNFDKE